MNKIHRINVGAQSGVVSAVGRGTGAALWAFEAEWVVDAGVVVAPHDVAGEVPTKLCTSFL